MRILATLLLASACGCLGAVAPIVDCAGKVTIDAAAGMSIAQIVADVGPACGLDVAAVINIILNSTKAEVINSRAALEAKRAQVKP
jgi:hypothetical protein